MPEDRILGGPPPARGWRARVLGARYQAGKAASIALAACVAGLELDVPEGHQQFAGGGAGLVGDVGLPLGEPEVVAVGAPDEVLVAVDRLQMDPRLMEVDREVGQAGKLIGLRSLRSL